MELAEQILGDKKINELVQLFDEIELEHFDSAEAFAQIKIKIRDEHEAEIWEIVDNNKEADFDGILNYLAGVIEDLTLVNIPF